MALYQWSSTAASNSTVGSINWAEGQAPSSVNNSAREMMAQLVTYLQPTKFVNVLDYGAVGDSSTDNQAAFTAAFAAVANGGVVIIPPAAGAYYVASAVNITGSRITVYAWGAIITGTANGTLFNIANGSNTVRDHYWYGGRWRNSNGTKTSSIGFKLTNCRNFQFEGMELGQDSKGFNKSFEITGFDTIEWRKCYFWYGNKHIEIASGATAAQTCIMLKISQCNFFPGNADDTAACTNWILAESRLNELLVESCNFSYGAAATYDWTSKTGIHIKSRAVGSHASYSLTPRNYTFINNKTEAGSGPTFATTTWLHLDDDSATYPFIGLTVDGLRLVGSGTSCVGIKVEKTEQVQLRNISHSFRAGLPWTFDANCRFIHVSGCQTDYNVTYSLTAATISFTASTKTIADSGSSLGFLNAGDIFTVRNSTSNDGTFTVVTAAADAITVSESVTDEAKGETITLKRYLPDAGTYACSRDEVTLYPEIRRVTANTRIDGFEATAFSDVTTETQIDMSQQFSEFPTDGIPKGYFLTVLARDSGSSTAAATACYFEIFTEASVDQLKRMRLNLSGMTDDAWYCWSGYVAADSAGDMYYVLNATGAGTMDLSIVVDAVVM